MCEDHSRLAINCSWQGASIRVGLIEIFLLRDLEKPILGDHYLGPILMGLSRYLIRQGLEHVHLPMST